MRRTSFCLSLLLASFLIFLSCGKAQAPSRLERYAAKAKAEGKRSISLSSAIGLFARVSNLQEALEGYSVIVAMPTARKILQVDKDQICTWYKLRVLEFVRRHPNPEEPRVEIPNEFSPVKQDELVIRLHGGALLIDGVQVLQAYSPIPALQMGQRYLMFTLPDKTGKFALLQAGSNAVFRIDSDDEFEPLSPKKTIFQRDIKERTGNKLNVIRSQALSVLPLGSTGVHQP